MTQNNLHLLLAVVGIVLSVLLAATSLLIAGVVIGLVCGVLGAPLVGRASAWLARYLGH